MLYDGDLSFHFQLYPVQTPSKFKEVPDRAIQLTATKTSPWELLSMSLSIYLCWDKWVLQNWKRQLGLGISQNWNPIWLSKSEKVPEVKDIDEENDNTFPVQTFPEDERGISTEITHFTILHNPDDETDWD